MAKQKFYLALADREYRGENGYYTISPLCENKKDAERFLEKEYERLSTEFGGFKEWEIDKSDDKFSLIDGCNYNLWGWIEEIEVESEFSGHRFGFTIFHTEHVDGYDDNDMLYVDVVFADNQSYRKEVKDKINELVATFKDEFPSDEYEETNDFQFDRYWNKSISFENGDLGGELNIWFEIHDII